MRWRLPACSRLVLGSLAGLLLVLGMLQVPLAAVAAPVQGSLTATRTSPLINGERMDLRGKLPPSAARTVVLQRRVDDGSWTNVKTMQSGSSGRFSFGVAAPSKVLRQVQYRVSAAAARIGGTKYPAAQTPTLTFGVVRQSSSIDAPAYVRVNKNYEVRGIFWPVRPGRAATLQRRSGGSWKTVSSATLGRTGAVTFTRPATAPGTSTYRVLARAYRGAPQIVTTSRKVTVVSTGDDEAPLAPTGLAGIRDGEVLLTWDAVTAPDLAGYRVYRGQTRNGPWTELTDGAEVGPVFVDGSPDPAATWYAVTSADQLNNQSQRSTAVQPADGDLTPPGTPTGLSAEPGDGTVHLGWVAGSASDLEGYRVYQSADGSSWDLVSSTLAEPELTLSGLTNGKKYFFAVTSLDAHGNESDRSVPAAATPVDATPPGVPSGLQAVASEGQVALAWNAVQDTDLAGYRVYQWNFAASVWDRVGDLRTERTATFTGLVNGTSYYYAVTSVDTAGNESAQSGNATATPRDRTAPPVPNNLAATAGDNRVDLNWNAVTDQGLAGYRVYRSSGANGPWTLATITSQTSATVSGLVNFTDHFFVVTAYDVAGNESAMSAPVSATPTNPLVQPQIEAGAQHTCRIKRTGSLWCWGVNGYGQLGVGSSQSSVPVQVGNDTHWSSLAVGWNYTCALKTSGTAWCWGDNNSGQLGTGTAGSQRYAPTQVGTATNWASLESGGSHTCGVKTDGTVWCWGSNFSGQLGDGTTTDRLVPTQVGTDADWARLTSGNGFTCGVKTDGTAWCWGSNSLGTLGDGTTTDHLTPTQVGGGTNWASLEGGSWHACGVKTDGTAWCWGYNSNGQLGDGSMTLRTTPTQIGTGAGWTSVSAHIFGTCGVKTDGTAWCWGVNGHGQLGDGTFTNRTTPTQVGGGTSWAAVTPGYDHTCGLKSDGTAWCWGWSPFGQGGRGQSNVEPVPLLIPGISNWADVQTGYGHSCGIRTDDSLWCWGLNAYGELGDGGTTTDRGPQVVAAGTSWRQVSAGAYHSCGVRTDHTAWCWGRNADGQLGDGSVTNRLTPTQVGSGSDWDSVVASSTVAFAAHVWSCGLKTDGTAWCWGGNDGQLGEGTTTPHLTPVQVGTDADWVQLTAGASHMCGLKDDGTAWCWGSNEKGQLGDGSTTTRLVPTQVGSDSTWAAIDADDGHTCATRTDGTAWCWGWNVSGQLGDGSSTDRLVPTQVGTSTNWRSVDAGRVHSCGVRTDGTAWCWGSGSGAGGDLEIAARWVPTKVGTATDWKAVAAGYQQTCGVKSDGSALCWGDNSYGQLGTMLNNPTPSQVIE
jgi:alpha-tubulin suppressor-like RCC1 family protein/fibronectin type 3 domain-containing protein